MSDQEINTGLGNVAYVVRSDKGATAIALGNITNSKIETVDEIHNRLMAYDDIKRELDEAREDLEFRRGLYKVQEEYLETARRERDEARDTNKKLREVLEWIAERYDDSKPMHHVAMDAYEMSCAARAILQKE